MSYFVATMAFTVFLFVYGLFFFLLSKKAQEATLIKVRTVFLIFAFFYLALSHFTLYTGIGLEIEEAYAPGCENLLIREFSVYSYGENYTSEHWSDEAGPPTGPQSAPGVNLFHINTTLTYNDTCAADGAPAAATALFTIASWILWIDAWAVFLGLGVLFVAWVMRRW